MDHPIEEPAVAEAPIAPDNIDTPDEQAAPDTEDELYPDDQSEDTEGDDEPDDEPEAEALPPIDAPGLKAEEKERFAKLPREEQEFVASVLQRRHIEAKTGIETERSAKLAAQQEAADRVAQTQREFAEQSARLVATFAPQPPPIELLQQDPNEYHYRKAVFDQEIAEFQGYIGQLSALHDEASQHDQVREQQANIERLRGWMTIPEVASEDTRAEFLSEIEGHGIELGFEREALMTMDSREMVALKRSLALKKEAAANKADADKWRAYKRQRNERPRAAQGRFSAAPAGARTGAQTRQIDTLSALYPND